VARANIEAQQAQVRRLEQLTGFERVVAPFNGVITSREVDIGNLINAGSGTGPELFRVADTSKLRIYVEVPQSYAASVSPAWTSICAFLTIPGDMELMTAKLRASRCQRSAILQASLRDGVVVVGEAARKAGPVPAKIKLLL
jgi:hypothetical protein